MIAAGSGQRVTDQVSGVFALQDGGRGEAGRPFHRARQRGEQRHGVQEAPSVAQAASAILGATLSTIS